MKSLASRRGKSRGSETATEQGIKVGVEEAFEARQSKNNVKTSKVFTLGRPKEDEPTPNEYSVEATQLSGEETLKNVPSDTVQLSRGVGYAIKEPKVLARKRKQIE